MRTITVRPGDGELPGLDLTEAPDPVPGPGQVLIDVAAAGVNPADVLQRRGLYPPPPGAPDTLGLEVSGSVAGVGPDAGSWRVGDAVAALLDGGGYATRVVAPAAQVLPVPATCDLVQAAALPEALCTAWSNLVDVGGLRPGATVLVHGGSGGVGTVAVQLALELGATVLTTAGGAQRAARCRELAPPQAADRLTVVDHRAEDFTRAVANATGGAGVDVVLDVVGAAYLERNVAALALGGRLVVIGMLKGRRGELDLGRLLARRASVHGTTLRARPAAEKAAIVQAVRTRAWPAVEAGRIRPVVHAQVPLADAAQAHGLLASGEVFGKVLLVP
ncbi:MAG: NAD(P)H-quinone oxidoreductase [Cellulomonadaceae bacterium]